MVSESLEEMCIKHPHWAAEEIRRYQKMHIETHIAINALWDKIAHGDTEHRVWLKEAIREHFYPKTKPSGTSQQ